MSTNTLEKRAFKELLKEKICISDSAVDAFMEYTSMFTLNDYIKKYGIPDGNFNKVTDDFWGVFERLEF